jgi:hypothetical protein
MYNINFIKSFLEDLHKKKIEKKILNLSKNYPLIKKEISITFAEIDEVVPIEGENNIEEVIEWTLNDLREYGIVPVITLTGGSIICLGVKDDNESQFFYFDYDFGIYKMNDTIEEFIEKLEPAIDYDSLTDAGWDALDTDEYWLNT